MKAIDLFPYWADNRSLVMDVVAGLRDDELEFRPAADLWTVGEVLRHIIIAEEGWWHGGIQGEPYERWRPEGWERLSPTEQHAHYRERFPTVAAILTGLRAAHAPIEGFLTDFDAADLCLKRRATWGEENTLRWIFWHLVEHDQHHRAQLYTRLRMLGHQPPQIWPRPQVMGRTPAGSWRTGEAAVTDVIPYWKHLHGALRKAVATLAEADLRFTPAPGRPTIHDLVLHIFIWEDFLIRQNLKGEMGRPSGKIEGWFWKSEITQLAQNVGPVFPTVEALLEGMDAVYAATRAYVEGLATTDLVRTIETPAGPETVHHVLWYAREHAVHHRAQVFLRMRMAGRTPPDL